MINTKPTGAYIPRWSRWTATCPPRARDTSKRFWLLPPEWKESADRTHWLHSQLGRFVIYELTSRTRKKKPVIELHLCSLARHHVDLKMFTRNIKKNWYFAGEEQQVCVCMFVSRMNEVPGIPRCLMTLFSIGMTLCHVVHLMLFCGKSVHFQLELFSKSNIQSQWFTRLSQAGLFLEKRKDMKF